LETSTIISDKAKSSVSLNNLWQTVINEQYAVAIWRLPKAKGFHFLVDCSGKPSKLKINFEETEPGFCISPFINYSGDKTLFLKSDFHFLFDENEQIIKEQGFNLAEKLFLGKTKSANNQYKEGNPKICFKENPTAEESFEVLVRKGIEKIEENIFQKVVLSRKKELSFENNISITEAFKKLCKKYPNAFISAVYLPEFNSIWMGASPELLVSLNADGLFKTMSLAGTQSVFNHENERISPSNARWSQKEIEEQAFVSRYIIECFKKVRVREYIENGPKTVEAGNLLHLQTDFSVDTKAIEFKQFATVMLELLHPTSAVCGMPKQAALPFILENEPYNREFYSGFLGPVNINGASNIFVNLRSLKIENNTASLFAGAGITEDSDPKKEWKETEMKMETLLNVFYE
jgi:isochorismate synthase